MSGKRCIFVIEKYVNICRKIECKRYVLIYFDNALLAEGVKEDFLTNPLSLTE